MPLYCNPIDQGGIIGMCNAGALIRTIANFLGVPPTTVHDTIQQFQERVHLENLAILGRTPKLNNCDLQELGQVLQQHRRETLVSIKNLITANVSLNTIRKAIHHLGKRSCISIKKQYLSPCLMERRLEFARAHLHWTINNWSQVVWMDESLFELGDPVTQKQVWQTPEQKFNLE
ncbi:hypothetical protein O181_103897 [Austropuccinia psidii MF-1]|uniref:Transposase Tc1-like domain-containing protein n=1 Tax=Austropuccinia psidii MF-1 TaxID=1389203 RepID=A0A9Q3JM11_9BASI|nr:hypothetical protein [Austropuccinia psidii MF-1]